MHIHLTELVKGMFHELRLDSNCQYVLSAKDNEPLSPKALSRSINRIQERVGIPGGVSVLSLVKHFTLIRL
jgi:hypothetical protein